MKGFSIKDEAQRLKDEMFSLRLDSAVRVEGPEDKPFWEAAFKAAVPAHKIKIFAESNYPTEGSTGKSNVLAFKRFTDKDLLLCVDADYDYLLQSESIVSVPFVFHTFAFAIENFFCNPAALYEVYLAAGGNAEAALNFASFIKAYSGAIHPLLLLSLASEKEKDGVFGLKKCGSAACPPIDWMAETPVGDWLEKIKMRAEELGNDIQPKLNKAAIEALEKQLPSLGATPENTCWFVRGHDWMGFMEQFLALAVFRSNQAEEKRHGQIPEEELAVFAEVKQKVGDLLRNHQHYSDGIFFEKLLQQIKTALGTAK